MSPSKQSRALTSLKAPFVPGPAAAAAPGHVGWRPGVAAWTTLIATAHTAAALLSVYPVSIVAWAYPLAVFCVPALSMALIPGQLHRAYRWLGLMALSVVVFPAWFFVVMIVGESWALYRAWTEATPADFARRGLKLRGLSSRLRPAAAK